MVRRALEQASDELTGTSAVQANGVKVFSATKRRDREVLGELITTWIWQHPECQLLDKVVTQSSDAEFHCLTITLFYRLAGT